MRIVTAGVPTEISTKSRDDVTTATNMSYIPTISSTTGHIPVMQPSNTITVRNSKSPSNFSYVSLFDDREKILKVSFTYTNKF
jgi:hypothetical protein